MGFNLIHVIQSVGLLGIVGIAFAETGLLIGFFLPGDSLLFSAGVLASHGYLNIGLLIVGAIIGGVAGDSVGYWIGTKAGPKIFTREDSLLFHHSYVERTKKFFDRHGPKAVVLARFVPIVRTFTPTLAGVGKMHYPTFLKYNLIGGVMWGIALPLLGFFLGSAIPNIDHYILPLIGIIVLLSFIPPIVEIIRERRQKKPTLPQK